MAVTTAPEARETGMRLVRVALSRIGRTGSRDAGALLGLTLFLVAFGLLMVLSSSYASEAAAHANPFAKLIAQGSYAAIGVPLMLLISLVPAQIWQKYAWPALGAATFLQLLVAFTPLGHTVNNSTNWLKLGPVVFQPSELIKLALVVWLGMFLTKKEHRLAEGRFALVPALVVCVVPLALIVKGGDLGTTMVLGLTVLGALFFAGIPAWQLAVTCAGGGLLSLALAFSSRSRVDRILAFLHPQASDPNGTGYQVLQGKWGMADGGVLGVGIGNSQSKWDWLPESSTDFIYAITGEELGLVGAVLVLLLFVALAVVMLRIIRTAPTVFARTVTGGVFAWITSQALINIAVVLGLFPVLGVPLPLFSSGGSSLIATLAALGIVLSFARTRRDSAFVA